MGGHKRVIENSKEKILSDDFNKMQSYIALAHLEVLRRLYTDRKRGFYTFPGLAEDRTGVESPLAASVIGGLMVRVDLANDLLIDPGCLLGWVPGLDAFSSDAILAVDPGVQTTGVLTFTANSGGSPRIDVIECQFSDVVTSSSSRDIFDDATETFTAATVAKVAEARLNYRIRLGTPGAGFPGVVADWLPLAVACVQDGATNFSQVDFWDVRPMVSDRVPDADENATVQHTVSAEYQFDPTTYGTPRWAGYADAVYGGYRAGGELRRSTASSLAEFGSTSGSTGGDVDNLFLTADNESSGFAIPANGWVCLAAVFPHDLPRWVRYSQNAVSGPGSRLPQGPRGILVITDQEPIASGLVVTTLPATSGFQGTHNGIVLSLARHSGAWLAMLASDGYHYVSSTSIFATITSTSDAIPFGPGQGVGSLEVPANVSHVEFELLHLIDVATAGRVGWGVSNNFAGALLGGFHDYYPEISVGSSKQFLRRTWVPMDPRTKRTNSTRSIAVFTSYFNSSAGASEIASVSLTGFLTGYRLES